MALLPLVAQLAPSLDVAPLLHAVQLEPAGADAATSPVVAWLADRAAPWKAAYDDSRALSVGVTYAHLAALLVAGGLALATDRLVWRATSRATSTADASDGAPLLAELGAAHAPVVRALVVVVASGVLLFLADVETFATSATYWVKLGLFVALLANGWRMTRLERGLAGAPPSDARWRALRGAAAASALLWLLTLLAGVLLANG